MCVLLPEEERNGGAGEGCTTDNVQLQNARLIHAQQSIPPPQLREKEFLDDSSFFFIPFIYFLPHADFSGIDGPFFFIIHFSVYFLLKLSARHAG